VPWNQKIINTMDKSNKLDFSGQDIYVGLDTHLKSWRTSIMVGESPYKTFSQDPSPKLLKDYLVRNFPNANYYSAYEASFSGFWTHRNLLNLGIKNIVVNPADIPTTDKERKQKEDSRDSRKIAKQLSQNDLTAIYVPEIEIEGDRSLIRYRKNSHKGNSKDKAQDQISTVLFWDRNTCSVFRQEVLVKEFHKLAHGCQPAHRKCKACFSWTFGNGRDVKKKAIFDHKRNQETIRERYIPGELFFVVKRAWGWQSDSHDHIN
jgi:hypothetical protein